MGNVGKYLIFVLLSARHYCLHTLNEGYSDAPRRFALDGVHVCIHVYTRSYIRWQSGSCVLYVRCCAVPPTNTCVVMDFSFRDNDCAFS